MREIPKPLDFNQVIKLVMVTSGAIGFLWGIFVWSSDLKEKRIAQRIEATKPFLTLQLELYQEVVGLSSFIATTDDENAKLDAVKKLKQLYWGQLSLVEDRQVEAAMVNLVRVIDGKNVKSATSSDPLTLNQAVLNLAHACRKSLDRSWGIDAWTENSSVKTIDNN